MAIGIIAILHVFVSHFAVGGGLFLPLTERKAYRENNPALLEYVKSHSKFFVLVVLVFGAVSGVGIWWNIGLVSPEATATLIHVFVWGWAIEWVFFIVEIAAAFIYYYGWDRLDPQTHLTVVDLFRGSLGQPAGHQRDFDLHAHAGQMDRETDFRVRVFQPRHVAIAAGAHGGMRGLSGRLCLDYFLGGQRCCPAE